MTHEYEILLNDPDLQAERGPHGTLIFQYGEQFCVAGQELTDHHDPDSYTVGDTREEALIKYFERNAAR